MEKQAKHSPLKVFLLFDNEDQEVVSEIEKHCVPLERTGKISIWHQGKINPGQIIENEVLRNIEIADVIILMISVNLLNSELFYEVEKIGIKRAKEKKSLLIPVYLKHCLFTGYGFTEFKMVPLDGDPVVKSGGDLTERCHNVADEIHNIVNTVEALSIENNKKTVFKDSTGATTNILYLVNDPDNLESEMVNEEINCIKHRLVLGKCSCNYELIPKNLKTIEDFQKAMLEVRPRIVHFSGYATKEDKLTFSDSYGEIINVKPASLTKLFTQFSDKLEIVFLNSCYSKPQADSISNEIKYVIGINGGVEKKISIDFVKAFYQAISYGTSIKKAYNLAINLLELKNLKYAENIVLLENESLLSEVNSNQ